MKVTRNNILEFLKLFRDLVGVGPSGHRTWRRHQPTDSVQSPTFQICSLTCGESRNHLSFLKGVAVRRKTAEEGRRSRGWRAAPFSGFPTSSARRTCISTLPSCRSTSLQPQTGEIMAGTRSSMEAGVGMTSEVDFFLHRRRQQLCLIPTRRGSQARHFGISLVRNGGPVKKLWSGEGDGLQWQQTEISGTKLTILPIIWFLLPKMNIYISSYILNYFLFRTRIEPKF